MPLAESTAAPALEQIAVHPSWFSCAETNLGHVRKINEDAFLDAREQGLWVVADGMGGHSRGDRASQSIIEALQSFNAGPVALENIDDLLHRLNQANAVCRELAGGKVMGSTCLLYTSDAADE